MMNKGLSTTLAALVAIGIIVVSFALLADNWLEGAGRILVIIAAVAAEILVAIGWAIGSTRRSLLPALGQVKRTEPVVYLGAFPNGHRLFIVSSNKLEDSIKIWAVRHQRATVMVSLKRSECHLATAEFQLSPLQKVRGVLLKSGSKESRLALYGSQMALVMHTLKGEQLSEAVRQLEAGAKE